MIIQNLRNEDMEVLSILESGSTLAGEIDAISIFQPSYKPCVTTENASKRNQFILSMTKACEDRKLGEAVLLETREG